MWCTRQFDLVRMCLDVAWRPRRKGLPVSLYPTVESLGLRYGVQSHSLAPKAANAVSRLCGRAECAGLKAGVSSLEFLIGCPDVIPSSYQRMFILRMHYRLASPPGLQTLARVCAVREHIQSESGYGTNSGSSPSGSVASTSGGKEHSSLSASAAVGGLVWSARGRARQPNTRHAIPRVKPSEISSP